jgi:hypothetical protein
MGHKRHLTKNTRGYHDFAYAPVPTAFTRFIRKCVIWQSWRWLVLNIKILRIVAFGHS